MKFFCQFIQALESTGNRHQQCVYFGEYLMKVEDKDKIWSLALIMNRGPKKIIQKEVLQSWSMEYSKIDPWLFEDSLKITSDFVETCALILPKPKKTKKVNLSHLISELVDLSNKDTKVKKERVKATWDELPITQRHVYCRLLTGSLRVMKPSPELYVTVARVIGGSPEVWAYKLNNYWDPATTTVASFLSGDDVITPYPFASFIVSTPKPFFNKKRNSILVQNYVNGLRVQLIHKDLQWQIWSKRGEFITSSFPEFNTLAEILPQGFVIEGQLAIWAGAKLLPSSALQTRLGRKVTKKDLLNAHAVICCYDLLELDNEDLRKKPLSERWEMLQRLIETHIAHPFLFMPETNDDGWEDLQVGMVAGSVKGGGSRILRQWDSVYGHDEKYIWHPNINPLLLVLTYVKKTNNILSEFTFSIWKNGELVPLVGGHFSFDSDVSSEILKYVKDNLLEKFGSTYMIVPGLVFEIKFDGITIASRKKSGIALLNASVVGLEKRILPVDASQIEDLQYLLPG